MPAKTWTRVTVNLEPAIATLAKARAAQEKRSMAAHLAKLLEDDIAAHGHRVEEAQAPYGVHVNRPGRGKDKSGGEQKTGT